MPFTLPLDHPMPDFQLAGTDGRIYSPSSFIDARAIALFFTCNHCPYVVGSDEHTRQIAQRFSSQGVVFVAINSNSSTTISEDSFSHMVERMGKYDFPWIYLYDETQEIAKTFGALRTPHFYLFDQNRRLRYCGRASDSPRDVSKISSNDLQEAIEDLLANRSLRRQLTNPIGCNIKWKGQDRHWMPAEACDLI